MTDVTQTLEGAMRTGWSYPAMFGILFAWVRVYLRGEMTRDEFTGRYAQLAMLHSRWVDALAYMNNPQEAAQAALEAWKRADQDPDLPDRGAETTAEPRS